MKKLLKNRLYMVMFANDMLSNFGDVVYYLALMAYVLQLSDAKLAIAVVSVSETLPILTGFVMGYFADKTVNKVNTILKTLYFRVFLYLVVGFIMGFEPELWVVIVAATINFLSDLSGQYENGLYTPLSLRIVSDEDRADSYAFSQAASSLLYIGFQSAGAVLVSIMSYQVLAVVNAGTFVLCAMIILTIKPSLEKLLLERPLEIREKSGNNLLKDMWSSMKLAVRECLSISAIRQSMLILPFLNGIVNIITIILPVIISQDKTFVFINPVTTLAVFTLFNLIGGIIGNFLAITFFKNFDFMAAVHLAIIPLTLLFFFLYIHNIYGVYACIFLTLLLSGMVIPKLNALVVNSLPEDKIAMITGGISTYFQLGTIILRLLVSALILVLPINSISMIFLLLGILLLLYAYGSKNTFADRS